MPVQRLWRHSWYVFSRLWRLPDAKRLLVVNLVLLLFAVAELLFVAFARPCAMSSDLYSEECGNTIFWIFVLVVPAKGALTVYALAGATGDRNSQALKSQLRKASDPITKESLSGWAAASAKDVFDGIVQVTASGQVKSMSFLLFYTLSAAASVVATDRAMMRSPQYLEFLSSTCSDASKPRDACRIAWSYKSVLVVCNSCAGSCFSIMPLLLRTEMWSPVFVHVIKEQRIRWLNRCLWMNWFSIPNGLVQVTLMFMGIRINVLHVTATEMRAFTWLAILNLIVLASIIIWTLDLDGLMLSHVSRLAALCCKRGRGSSVSPILEESPADQEKRQPLNEKPARASKNGQADSSFRHRQVLTLASLLMLMSFVHVGSWATAAGVWAMRLLGVVLLLWAWDDPCTLSELQRTDPAFGLVIDADHLRDALIKHLGGGTYTGPLTKTRGTYYRMDDTLAVSYRWGTEEVQVCQGLHLNMSRWQLEELLGAITSTGCLYVWIDRQALPQQQCKLQTTLLARMMAIYAACKITLVLRSLETDKNRYHQRAWTLQEYCNAKELMIRTQAASESETAGCVESALAAAVSDEEEELFAELRAWHRSRLATCRPYWLWGFSLHQDGDGLKEAIYWHGQLVDRVVCLHAADKIRALYPMLFNTPCEDQAELVGLVGSVAEHQVPNMTWKGQVLAGRDFKCDVDLLAGIEEGGDIASIDKSQGRISPEDMP